MKPSNSNMPCKVLFFFLLLISCKPSDGLDRDIPSELKLEITVSPNDPKTILIVAEAADAVKYEIWIGNATQPALTGTTGNFSYTFPGEGEYEVTLRVYGISGKFIYVTRTVEIKLPVLLDEGYTTPLQYNGYALVWNDEFSGTALNALAWTHESGDGCPAVCGWGNNELQYYKRDNTSVDGGTLIIEARKENIGTKAYSSSRIKTQNLKSFRYGRIDVRALLPEGQGIWPAVWMLGNNITTVGWPACGEIDIIEMIGGNGREKEVHGTLHWDNGGHASSGGKYTLASGTFADEYHVFTVIWNETSIKWYVNDVVYNEIDITPSHMTEFHEDFFFIVNLAVGGNWPGSPNASTLFPQQLKVDYIRIFQKEP
jgi:beta-glucanase (GH16 family)